MKTLATTITYIAVMLTNPSAQADEASEALKQMNREAFRQDRAEIMMQVRMNLNMLRSGTLVQLQQIENQPEDPPPAATLVSNSTAQQRPGS